MKDPAEGPLEESEEETENEAPPRKVYVHREKSYGGIDGVETGDWWETRMECSQAGIHRLVSSDGKIKAITINLVMLCVLAYDAICDVRKVKCKPET